ncbi:hypothetical protein [Aminobacter sp. MSH1]|uniref:hypothetical protein n=1 Tax=Aminobacter sp. MSH1 TaxID=374606 RepID=UPI000D3A3EA8|nr:hypothetical protein [Aminobacter sp. MSH1]
MPGASLEVGREDLAGKTVLSMIDERLVRTQVRRIVESDLFRPAPRMQRFLSFVVEEALAGRSAYLKEYAIAQRVFDKSSDFDPRLSPIVRVEAGRLRRLLTLYYLQCHSAEVSVQLPKGTYVPVFLALRPLDQETTTQAGSELPARDGEVTELGGDGVGETGDARGPAVPQSFGSAATEKSISHCRMALEAIRKLPDAKERWQRELNQLSGLGNAIRTSRGYGDDGLPSIYDRSLFLCEKLDSWPELAEIVYGQWACAAGQANWGMARRLADQFAGMSLNADADAQMSVEAHRVLATNKIYAGDFVAARLHLERCLSLYDAERDGPRFGYDPGPTAATYLAWVLWHLGLQDQASLMAGKAIRLAAAKDHGPTTALVLTYLAFFEIYRGDVDAVLAHTDRLFALCSKHGYKHWLTLGVACAEWAQCQLDHRDCHIETLLSAEHEQQRLWGGFFTPGLLILAADLCRLQGKPVDGVRLATKAKRFVASHGELLWEAECDRLLGENLMMLRGPSIHAATIQLQKAISTAKRQSAPSLEQRAHRSLRKISEHGRV